MKEIIMFEFQSLGHFNIVVDNIDEATKFYCNLFNCEQVQTFPRFKNIGFAKSAGFLSNAHEVEVTIRFIKIPKAEIYLELFEYHNPKGSNVIAFKKTNDIGGARHICIRVKNIDEAFTYIKSLKDVTLISDSPDYKPFQIDDISPEQFYFHDSNLENNSAEKQSVCKIIGTIRYFYFIDKYGLQWELEEGHDDIGN